MGRTSALPLSFITNLSYLDNIRSSGILRADTGDGDSLSKPLDEAVLKAVHLLEEGIEVCHFVVRFMQIRPDFGSVC